RRQGVVSLEPGLGRSRSRRLDVAARIMPAIVLRGWSWPVQLPAVQSGQAPRAVEPRPESLRFQVVIRKPAFMAGFLLGRGRRAEKNLNASLLKASNLDQAPESRSLRHEPVLVPPGCTGPWPGRPAERCSSRRPDRLHFRQRS